MLTAALGWPSLGQYPRPQKTTGVGQVLYSTNLATWNHIPGTLALLILLQ